VKRKPRESAGPIDDAEYERLLDMYDVSFKNFAEASREGHRAAV